MLTRSKCEIICMQLRSAQRKPIAPESSKFMKKLLTMIPVETDVADSVAYVNTSVIGSFGSIFGTLIMSLVPSGMPVIV